MATRATTKKGRFLRLLAETGNVTLAAEAAGVARQTPYKWRDKDSKFAEAWAAAEEEAADRLEAEARRRAVEGVEKPVYQGGHMVGTIREYSDTLLIFLLKGARPEKYKDRQAHEHSGPGGGPVALTLETLQELYANAHSGEAGADAGGA